MVEGRLHFNYLWVYGHRRWFSVFFWKILSPKHHWPLASHRGHGRLIGRRPVTCRSCHCCCCRTSGWAGASVRCEPSACCRQTAAVASNAKTVEGVGSAWKESFHSGVAAACWRRSRARAVSCMASSSASDHSACRACLWRRSLRPGLFRKAFRRPCSSPLE